jgi:hypothetical protein
MVREVLATTFKDIALPGSKETPTASTIDSYMTKLQTTITSEPAKHPALVEKVSTIAKHLERILKEKASSKDTPKKTVLDEERKEGEGQEQDEEEPMTT